MSIKERKRFHVLTRLIQQNKFRLGVEVGTGKGQTSEFLLRNNPKLHLVQIAYYPGNLTGHSTEKAHLLWLSRIKPYITRSTIINDTSKEAAKLFEKGSVDFVFIDANHNYEYVKEDIALWWPKVKKGGVLSGHDYGQPVWPGVKKAVDEFFESVQTGADYVWYHYK